MKAVDRAMGVLRLLAKPAHPKPSGEYALGCIRGRLPAAEGHEDATVFAQVYYPADARAPPLVLPRGQWLRPELIQRIAVSYGVPLWVLQSLLGGARMLEPTRAPLQAPEATGWPLVVFVSGLFGSCEMYSQFCREVASLGVVVIAMEHEDGSAVFAKSGATGEVIEYVKEPWGASKEEEIRRRAPRLARRRTEIDATLACLARATSAESKPPPGSSPETAALHGVLQGVDCQRLLLMAHSFGSTSAVDFLQRAAREGRKPFAGAVLADFWTEPLSLEDMRQPLGVGFLLMYSGQWDSSKARGFVDAHQEEVLGIETVDGTKHQWISESHFMMPGWLGRRMGMFGTGNRVETLKKTLSIVSHAMHRMIPSNGSMTPPGDG